MTPEYRVYVPEESAKYLTSFLKHIKGSRTELIAPKPKTSREKKIRDPKANEVLARRVKDEIQFLPSETSLHGLVYTPSENPFDDGLPERWIEFRRGLEPGDKIVLTSAFYTVAQVLGRDATLVNLTSLNREAIRKNPRRIAVSNQKLDFIQNAFLKGN